jgi:hypothetical protein
MKSLIVCICLFVTFSVSGQSKQPVTVTDMLKIKSIGNVTLSADGNKAAFTVTAIENANGIINM